MPENKTDLLNTTLSYVDAHDCPYANRLIDVDTRKSIGGYGLNLMSLQLFVDQLQTLHRGNVCPPTHAGPTSPTAEWADWVQDTQV